MPKTNLFVRLLQPIFRPKASAGLPDSGDSTNWDIFFAQGKAYQLREPLKQAAAQKTPLPTDALLAKALAADWSTTEREKLAAYCEFYSGRAAEAYQRVLSGGLARMDYPLLMTACVHCYTHDRFAEGYALLKQFDSETAEQLDDVEYLPYAGFLALAGGGPIDEVIGYFDQALDRGLVSPLLVVNAYLAYFEAGNHARVAQLHQLAHERYLDDPEVLFALACVELARDYYPEGFRLAEARYRMPEAPASINSSLLSSPRWQGEPLTGKRLLVHGEQGLGDIVMMARYLPLLRAQDAHVVVDCREAAIPLLQHNFPDCEIIPGDVQTPLHIDFDWWTGAMSLPFHFATTRDTAPAKSGYLSAPPEQAAYWHARVDELAKGIAKIGIAWSGYSGHRADKRRSIGFERMVRCLRAYPLIDFFPLQTNVPSSCPVNLHDTSEEMMTLADTAALIAEMDLVITVDTSVVHIAGALGKRTWLLLPYRYEWRWSLTGEKNNWYDSVRVLRQEAHGDWDSLLNLTFGQRLDECLGDLTKRARP